MMYGVVLWADQDDSKAVIWCEDHGDLAFYSAGDRSTAADFQLDAGDLIRFDLREHENLRLAKNPMLVAEGHSADLAGKLGANAKGATPARRARPKESGIVLSLDAFRKGVAEPA